jgi:hypothetical protein
LWAQRADEDPQREHVSAAVVHGCGAARRGLLTGGGWSRAPPSSVVNNVLRKQGEMKHTVIKPWLVFCDSNQDFAATCCAPPCPGWAGAMVEKLSVIMSCWLLAAWVDSVSCFLLAFGCGVAYLVQEARRQRKGAGGRLLLVSLVFGTGYSGVLQFQLCAACETVPGDPLQPTTPPNPN